MKTNAATTTRPRGRPPGPTAKSEATRQLLWGTALRLFAERGFAGTTLREIGDEAGVSPGLLYRYFPAKHALVLAFYDELSGDYAARAERMPAGSWRDRFLFALRCSLDVLAPHRATLRGLVSVVVADDAGGVFAPEAVPSRERVRAVFHAAVAGARDAPKPPIAAALGNLLYVLHLGVILLWLLDRSADERAVPAVLALLERGKAFAALAVRLPYAHSFILAADTIVRESLLLEETPT